MQMLLYKYNIKIITSSNCRALPVLTTLSQHVLIIIIIIDSQYLQKFERRKWIAWEEQSIYVAFCCFECLKHDCRNELVAANTAWRGILATFI